MEMWPSDTEDNHDPESRATIFSGKNGEYMFECRQPSHIHMGVSAPGYETIFTNAYHPDFGQIEGRFDIVLRKVP